MTEYGNEALLRVVSLLPSRIGRELLGLSRGVRDFCSRLYEIRLRASGGSLAVVGSRAVRLSVSPTAEELGRILLLACDNAIYAQRDRINRGYVTLEGGIRVGIGGRAGYDGGQMVGLSEICSLVFRIPRSVTAIEEQLYAAWCRAEGGNLLIAAPPCGGKTTALRSLAVAVARHRPDLCSVIVDERGELSRGLLSGVGVDVLSGYDRRLGIEVAYRTMSARAVFVDEIATEDEAAATLSAMGAGISVVATCHGGSAEELADRKCLMPLIDSGMFKNAIILSLGREGLFFRETSLARVAV